MTPKMRLLEFFLSFVGPLLPFAPRTTKRLGWKDLVLVVALAASAALSSGRFYEAPDTTAMFGIGRYIGFQSGPPPTITVTPGSQTFTASGTWTFQNYNSLVVKCWGPGGGGGAESTDGSNGSGATTFSGLTANAGAKGLSWSNSATGGAGGTASGGTTNTTGNAGETALGQTYGGAGGANPAAGSGAGGARKTSVGVGNAGSSPGGAGGAAAVAAGKGSSVGGGGGGAGGYVQKTYVAGDITANVTVTIGTGGAGGNDGGSKIGGAGARGECQLSWT
jgi:hypothetical protein